jgi:hypothetical protein
MPHRIVRIGRERVRRILHSHDITFQRTRTWKESRDPAKDAKLDRIEEVMSRFPDRVFAFDQFGPLSVRPCHGTCWAGTKHRTGWGRTTATTASGTSTAATTWPATSCGVCCTSTRAVHTPSPPSTASVPRAPTAHPIYIVLDNLSCNTTAAIRTWAAAHKVELCPTPTNASWADPIEAQFGPLRTFTMANSDHPSHAALARRLHAYLRWRNANARDPRVLDSQRCERARVRSEKSHCWDGPSPAPPDQPGDPSESAH